MSCRQDNILYTTGGCECTGGCDGACGAVYGGGMKAKITAGLFAALAIGLIIYGIYALATDGGSSSWGYIGGGIGCAIIAMAVGHFGNRGPNIDPDDIVKTGGIQVSDL